MNEAILFVDDEPNILTGFKRQLGENYNLFLAESGREGLKLAQSNKFAVVVSDFKMPEMNGVEFLMKFRELYPDTIRIMLTGQADLNSIVEIINEGNIFRFLTKPCATPHLLKNIDDALMQHSLINAEKDLLTKTLTGAIQAMTEMLVLAKPQAFNRSIRIREIVKTILSGMEVENGWQVEIAAMLSQLGCVTIPGNVLEKIYRNLLVAPEHKIMFQKHIKTSSEIIAKIPRMEKIAEIIAFQDSGYDGSGVPIDEIRNKKTSIEAHILRVALDYDQLQMMDKKKDEAIDIMRGRKGRYDESILNVLVKKTIDDDSRKRYYQKKIKISELTDDMILACDVINKTGIIIGEQKQRINKTLLLALANYAQNNEISEMVDVIVSS